MKQLLRTWLSPSDLSTNHNIARKAQHNGTAIWLFQGGIVIEWKTFGSFLWIYGKRAFLLLFPASDFRQPVIIVAGSGKSVIWFVVLSLLYVVPYLFFTSSSIIQDITAVCETGSAIMAYFYFDFRDLSKQTCHDLLRSLVFQLSTDSSPCCEILHRVYKEHKDGTQQPSDNTLKECLKAMLRHPAHGQKSDIANYIQNIVNSSSSAAMRRWRADDKNLVIETLTERADGM